MASGNTSFSAVITRTLQAHGTEIFDAVSGSNALLWTLRKKGNVKVKSGGRTFTHPVIFDTNSSFRTYTKYEAIDVPDPDVLTRAEYNVRILAGSTVLSDLELAQNAGDREKLLDYADEKKQETQISMNEAAANQIWQASPGANDWDSIPNLINGTPSTQTNVGGIDPSATDNAYWRNQTYTTAVTAFNTSSAGLTMLSTLLNDCSHGTYGPKIVVTTKAIWGLYDVGLAGNKRYGHADYADAGFQNLDYAGMPVLADSRCVTSALFMIDTDSLQLQVLKQGNFVTGSFVRPANQLSEIAITRAYCNLTCGQRRTQGRATNITG